MATSDETTGQPRSKKLKVEVGDGSGKGAYAFDKIKVGNEAISFPMSPTGFIDNMPSLKWVEELTKSLKKIVLNIIPLPFSLPRNVLAAIVKSHFDPPSFQSLDTIINGVPRQILNQPFEVLQVIKQINETTLQAFLRLNDLVDLLEAEVAVAKNPRGAISLLGHIDSSISVSSSDMNNTIRNTLCDLFSKITTIALGGGKADSIRDYNDLFRSIPLPEISSELKNNDLFAHLQVAGPNPVLLRRMNQEAERQLLEVFPSTPPMAGDDWNTALAEGRLYTVNFAAFKDIQTKANYYQPAPVAVFVKPVDSPYLKCVCIKCSQDPTRQDVFTPSTEDDYGWQMAKGAFMSAYGNHHELISHLGNTHLLIERIAVATVTVLDQSNAVYRLLIPHFEGTFFINHAAARVLINQGGAVDKLISADLESGLRLMVQLIADEFNFNDHMLPNNLQRRGVSASETGDLYYPYRDDSLEYWNVIKAFVSQYLRLYYTNGDADVVADNTLQQWAELISSEHGGGIKGFGDAASPTPIATFDYLVNAVTMIIFTASVQHAAVNYPQADMMAYAPAFPLRYESEPPVRNSRTQEEDWLRSLPSLDTAKLQMRVGYLLGSVYYKTLDKYTLLTDFSGPAQKCVAVFKANLKKVGDKIRQRLRTQQTNSHLPAFYQYDYLLPENVPQSINI